MPIQKFTKRALYLSFPILLLLATDFIILQGGFLVQKAGVIPPRTRLAAAAYETPEKIANNLKIKNFSFKSKTPSGSAAPEFKSIGFKKGETVIVSCAIENAGNVAVNNFKSFIRTNTKDVASKYTNALKPGQTITLEGEFSVESPGITYLACRTEKALNHEIAALYFF